MNAAIVSTHKAWDRNGLDWADHHLALGFSKIYVFIDSESLECDCDVPGVEAIFCGADYWRSHLTWPGYEDQLSQVRAAIGTPAWGGPAMLVIRQALNVCSGLDRARTEGMAWLLHIDGDEYFWCPDVSVKEHFECMTEQGIVHAHYWNHEAVVLPSAHQNGSSTVFLKKNWEALTDEQRSLIPSLCLGKPYFLSYSNGKSAAYVEDSTEPHGVHYFKAAGAPPSNCRSMSRPGICHVPYRSVDQFCDKHLTLGVFDDRIYDAPWVPQQLYSEAREFVRRGDVEGLRKLYEDRVLVGSAEFYGFAERDFLIEFSFARSGALV